MKTLKDFINEAPEDTNPIDTKKSVVSFIASNFYRFINSTDENDTKSLMMLVAALSVLNSGVDQQSAIQVARRLAQAALQRSGKKKV